MQIGDKLLIIGKKLLKFVGLILLISVFIFLLDYSFNSHNIRNYEASSNQNNQWSKPFNGNSTFDAEKWVVGSWSGVITDRLTNRTITTKINIYINGECTLNLSSEDEKLDSEGNWYIDKFMDRNGREWFRIIGTDCYLVHEIRGSKLALDPTPGFSANVLSRIGEPEF